jgi:beta-glucosidase/6-phospho-beta-glucosidase/beta-galactosidase
MLLLLAACSRAPTDSGGPAIARPFPADFTWGVATAGFQVDMGCPTLPAADCDDRASDWWQWVNDPEIVADPSLFMSGDPMSLGPGMWETFEDDVAVMAADGDGGLRSSIEWSRLFPDGAAEAATDVDALAALADPDAVARYHAMLAATRAAGITPFVTMNHYTLPLWVHDGVACHADIAGCAANGWVDRDRIVPLLRLYGEFLGQEFGGEVDVWFTLNEPYATSLAGYILPGEDRVHPPGLSLAVEPGVAVILNQIDGSAALYDGVKATDLQDADGDGEAAQVGIVMNMIALDPRDPSSAEDLEGVAHADYLYHELYLAALTTGAWDADLDGIAETVRPELAGHLDLLGINYYNQVIVTGLPFPVVQEIPTFDLVPEFNLAPYPEGLGRVVDRAAAWGLPLWITENGTSLVETDEASDILDDHLASLWGRIDAGADVRGYFYWSYVDNYEWNHGFDLRFGLYALDTATKARTARPVADRYRTIIRQNGLE